MRGLLAVALLLAGVALKTSPSPHPERFVLVAAPVAERYPGTRFVNEG